MSKDIFESQIGTMLRNAEAPVPSGAWAAIRAQIPSVAVHLPKSSFGFGTAMIAGAVVLMSLGIYSETREISTPQERSLTQIVTMNEPLSAQNDAPVETGEPAVEATALDVAEPSVSNISEDANIIAISSSSHQETDAIAEIESVSNIDISENVDPAPTRNYTSQVDRAAQPEIAPVISSIDRQPHSEDVSTPAAEKLNVAIKKSATVGYAPFKVTFENLGNASSQLWDFGQFGKSAERKTEVVFTDPGTYTVWLTAFSEGGEQDAKYVTIDVREGSSCYLPNSIKPDGVNRVLKAEGVNLKSFVLTVVNSTGSIVFQSRDIDEPWVFDPSLHDRDGEIYIATVQAVGLDGKNLSIAAQRINIVY